MNPLDTLFLKYFEWVDDTSFRDKQTGEIFNTNPNTKETCQDG